MSRACSWLAVLPVLALAALVFGLNGYLLVLALCLAAAAVLLAYRHNEAACAIWLVVTGCTLEMWLGDLLGPDAYQPIIAVVKTIGLMLAMLAALRFGPRLDPFNPAFAYAFMFATGLIHGLHPGLTVADSLRSLAGSAAPFAFSFSRLSRRWADQIIRIVAWTPLIDVALGAVFGALGIRPLFIDAGGARLAALSHPAFLAGFALAGIYASLIELFRTGTSRWLTLLLANLAILLLTGARAPATYGLAVIALALALAPCSAFPRSRRLGLILGLAACLPAVLLLAGDLAGLRLFNAAFSYAGDLSGRGELWPAFENAATASPWFGWGLGAGNTIIAPTSQVAETLHTWAAHNEYLRIEVEGGQIGRGLLILLFALWCWRNSSRLPLSDRIIIRLVFIAFACHAVTDNVLISTSASALFTLISAVFARGRLEADSGVSAHTQPELRMTLFRLLAFVLVLSPLPALASGLAIVMNSGGASLSLIDMSTQHELRREPVLREPHHWALTPDGRTLVVGDSAGNELLLLDPDTGALRRRLVVADPYQLGFSPNGRFLVVNGLARNQIDVYSMPDYRLLKRFPIRSMPSHLAFSPDSGRVFVTLQGSDRAVALDLRTMTTPWDKPIGNTPAGILWNHGRLLVADMGTDYLAELDPADGHTLRRIVTGRGAHNLFHSPDGQQIWVNNRVAGTITVLDSATLNLIRTYRVPGGPDDLSFAPDGKVWVTRRFAESVAVLDPATGHYQLIAAGRSPHGIFLNPNASTPDKLASR